MAMSPLLSLQLGCKNTCYVLLEVVHNIVMEFAVFNFISNIVTIHIHHSSKKAFGLIPDIAFVNVVRS